MPCLYLKQHLLICRCCWNDSISELCEDIKGLAQLGGKGLGSRRKEQNQIREVFLFVSPCLSFSSSHDDESRIFNVIENCWCWSHPSSTRLWLNNVDLMSVAVVVAVVVVVAGGGGRERHKSSLSERRILKNFSAKKWQVFCVCELSVSTTTTVPT